MLPLRYQIFHTRMWDALTSLSIILQSVSWMFAIKYHKAQMESLKELKSLGFYIWLKLAMLGATSLRIYITHICYFRNSEPFCTFWKSSIKLHRLTEVTNTVDSVTHVIEVEDSVLHCPYIPYIQYTPPLFSFETISPHPVILPLFYQMGTYISCTCAPSELKMLFNVLLLHTGKTLPHAAESSHSNSPQLFVQLIVHGWEWEDGVPAWPQHSQGNKELRPWRAVSQRAAGREQPHLFKGATLCWISFSSHRFYKCKDPQLLLLSYYCNCSKDFLPVSHLT